MKSVAGGFDPVEGLTTIVDESSEPVGSDDGVGSGAGAAAGVVFLLPGQRDVFAAVEAIGGEPGEVGLISVCGSGRLSLGIRMGM